LSASIHVLLLFIQIKYDDDDDDEEFSTGDITFRKTRVFKLKSPNHWVLLGFGLHCVFSDFYLNEQLGSLFVILSAKILFRFLSTLDYLQIWKFIT